MSTDFKLSYTGSQINEKLNKIDSLAEKSELPTKISDLTNDSDFATKTYIDNAVSNAVPTHSWNGTTLTITSASGTSSANLKGEKGDTGKDGEKGDTGATGPAGPTGKTAYQYAKDGGYTGTESEFAKKLAEDMPDTLPNPYSLTINGKSYDGSESVNVIITGGTTGGSTSLGQTPVTLKQSASIKLVGDGEYSYNIKGKTVADLSTVAKTNTSASVTEKEGCYETTATGGANWYNAYTTIVVDGLTENTPYTLCVKGTNPSLANKIGGSYFIVKTPSGTQLAAQLCDSNKLFSIAFTPDSSSVTITWYPANLYYWNNDCKTSIIEDFYINEASDGTERTGVFNKTGTFTDSYSLGMVSKGVTISTTPSCEVYAVSGGGEGEASAALTGKTVVCFGDSLFGMYTGDTSAPAYVANKTGATVHNVGFGGCRMSEHPYTGYNEFCMYALANAVASGDWSLQDSAASEGSANFPDQLAILKSIDFNAVDYIVIHYGTNDFAAGSGVAIDNASNPKATNTLCGALRYSIETLLRAYPKLQIFVSLPVYRFWTENGVTTYAEDYVLHGHTLLDFVEALRKTAAEYNLPVIDGFHGMGVNKHNASAYLSDGTHHNVEGRKLFGEYIGAKLISAGDTFHGVDFENGGSSASIDVTAEVGQTIVVEEVDANGKPTKWKAVEYQEKICGIKEVVVFPETTITDGFYELPAALPLVENVEYAVSLDGTKYIGIFKRGEDPTSLYFDCDDFPNESPVQYYEIPDSIRFIQTNGQTILSITEMGVEPIATKYVENALPYYIEVLSDGYPETPDFHISETVEKLVPILESGRDVILRIEDYYSSYPVFTICRLARIFNDNDDMHSARLMFKDSFDGILYKLLPQDNGTYSIEILDTQ